MKFINIYIYKKTFIIILLYSSHNFESFLKKKLYSYNILHLECTHLHMCVLIQVYNKLTITTSIRIIKLLIGLKGQFCLWIHNCFCYSPLHGACSELLDCHIVLICTEPWVVSPSVLCTLHHLQHRCHCFEMLPWVAAF